MQLYGSMHGVIDEETRELTMIRYEKEVRRHCSMRRFIKLWYCFYLGAMLVAFLAPNLMFFAGILTGLGMSTLLRTIC